MDILQEAGNLVWGENVESACGSAVLVCSAIV